MATKLGEVQSVMTADVKKTDDFKIGWADKLKEMAFKPSGDLKKGDKVKITVEKL